MTHTPHDLITEFPNQTTELRDLKVTNAHFAKLAERYNEINKRIHQAETLVEPVSPEHEIELRRERMVLKDQIARILAQPVSGK